MERTLHVWLPDRQRQWRWATLVVFTILAGESFLRAAAFNHAPLALLAWPPLVLLAARRPLLAIFVAAVILRLAFVLVCCTDQIAVSQSAWERVISGLGGPYGVGYASTTPPGAPFPYGPLALVWWIPGPVVELGAAFAIMSVLAWQRALLTLAAFAVWQPSVSMTLVGVNDYSPSLLILVGMLALRWRPRIGAAVLALAAALKPYAFAWFVPAIGYGGVGVAAVLIGATAVLWSPLFLWWGGLAPFLKTVQLAEVAHPMPGQTLNLPVLRWLAVPLVALSLAARRWDDMVILGSAAFVIFLFLAHWASFSYWLAVLPILGLALEHRWLHPSTYPGMERRGLRNRRQGSHESRAVRDVPVSAPLETP